jgi:hypothetical protein
MVQKNNDDDATWESSIGWDHPLVVAGLVPGHLLRDAFGYSIGGWSEWVNCHPRLYRLMKRRPWFHLETFVAWVADATNADDLPPSEEPKTNGRKKPIPAQPGHNRTEGKRRAKPAKD